MIKFLECPDIHKDPERGDIWGIVSKSILKEAKEQAVDYVAFPGDFWKAVTTNDNKGGIAEALTFIEELTKICPVCAIEGTPSHDAPGSYEILERAGLVLLKPGKVYFYDRNNKIISEDNAHYDAILFGVPELNKNNIHAHLNLSSEQANGKAVAYFENYMDSFVAPMRLKYADIPAHMLFHGNVSDARQENTKDIILKASDIVIHSDVFARANLTRVSLGHIHKPWESEICNMGYAGSPGLKWGERDFIPAMNLVIDGVVSRLEYGTPMRKKVYKASSITNDPNIAWWLVSENETLPEKIHLWSKVTKPSNMKKASRRVSAEEIEATKSLWELALKFDPEINPILKPKFDMLQEKNKKESTEKVNIVIDDVEVLGCKFFAGDRAFIDFNNLNNGLTAIGGEINGKCNGIGKSGIASFCSPYPTVVGKDTKSGRSSALKDFFDGKDSRVIKHLTVNGIKHEHIITLKAAHTASGGKVECYLNIAGVPQLTKGTFDEMQTMCESLYGNYQDYLLTSFYVQPLQGKSGSSIMSESMTVIRDLVLNIAGIDRTAERRMALDKVAELEEELKGIDIKIKYAEDNLENKEPIEIEISTTEESIKLLQSEIIAGNKTGLALKTELERLTARKKVNDNNKAIVLDKEIRVEDCRCDELRIPEKIAKLEKSISGLEKDKEALKQHEKDLDSNRAYLIYDNYITARNSLNIKLENLVIPNREELELQVKEYQEVVNNKKDNTETTNKYNKSLQDYTIAKSNFDHSTESLTSTIKSHGLNIKAKEEFIAVLNKPCEHCGKLSSKADEDIKKLDDELSTIVAQRLRAVKELDSLKFELVEPEYPKLKPTIANAEDSLQLCKNSLSNITILEAQKKDIENDINNLEIVEEPIIPKKTLQPDFIIDDIKKRVEQSESIKIELSTTKNELLTAQKRKAALLTDIANIVIDNEIDGIVALKNNEINILRKSMTEKQSEGSKLQAELKALNDRITAIDVEIKRIETMKNGVAGQYSDKEQWLEVAAYFGSNKIPGFELDCKLDAIDLEATKILNPYQEGQYSFDTTTQQPGKKQSVDKFDIKIHDDASGIEKSFLEFSPGVKAVFSDAYVKALLEFRNENTYNPIIVDEADNPVNPKHIAEFYRIQEEYFNQSPEQKVIVISQKTEAKAYIENYIDIKEIRCHK